MITSIFGLLAILLALLAAALQRFYSAVPAKELKRLAARGDHLAKVLYRPVAYGASLRLLLWSVVTVALPVGLFLLLQAWPPFAVLPCMILVFGLMFVWLPSAHLSVYSVRLATMLAPAVEKILAYTHGLLDPLARSLNRYRAVEPHSGLFEKEDFAALVAQQKTQVDNRLVDDELELLERTLHFSDKQAADIVQPRKEVKMLKTKETLGPILMDELHKSGQPSFLVYDDDPDHVVGTLTMRQAATAKQGGKVADLMRKELCFVHEDFTLPQVIEALAQTKQYSAVVVNSFEEMVGIITLEQLLREAFGEHPAAADISYEDRISVAAYRPESDTPAQKDQQAAPTEDQATEAATSSEQPEVVK